MPKHKINFVDTSLRRKKSPTLYNTRDKPVVGRKVFIKPGKSEVDKTLFFLSNFANFSRNSNFFSSFDLFVVFRLFRILALFNSPASVGSLKYPDQRIHKNNKIMENPTEKSV